MEQQVPLKPEVFEVQQKTTKKNPAILIQMPPVLNALKLMMWSDQGNKFFGVSWDNILSHFPRVRGRVYCTSWCLQQNSGSPSLSPCWAAQQEEVSWYQCLPVKCSGSHSRAGAYRLTMKAWKSLPDFKRYSGLCLKFTVELWPPVATLPRHISREAIVIFALRKQI